MDLKNNGVKVKEYLLKQYHCVWEGNRENRVV